ncbi:hypothetical protein AAC387_Pa05g0289 [Persea americana]
MINSEVVITYKRKRPSSQLKLCHELNGTNSSLEPLNSISSTRLTREDEPGNLSEKQKGHDLKHSPCGKQLCSPCSEPQNSGKPVQQQIQEPKKARDINCLERCEMEPITLRSRKVLQKLNPGENASSESKDGSLQVEASLGKKSESTQINFYSNLGSGSMCDAKCVAGSLGSQLEDTTKSSRSACADSPIERKCEIGFIPDVSLSGDSPEANNLSCKVKSSITCTDSHPEKFSNPMITYSRKAKKKCVEGAATQKKLIDENRLSVVGWGNSASNVSSLHQEASERCDSVNQLIAVVLEMNQLPVHRQDGQEEIACKEEDHTLHSTLSGGASETKISGGDADHKQETWRYTSVGSSVVEGVQELDSLLHLPSSHPKPDDTVQEDHCHPQFMETSPADRSNEAKQSTSPKSGASIGEEFRVTSYVPTKKCEGITKFDDILEGGTLAQLDLSVDPPCLLSPSKGESKQRMQIDPPNPSNANHSIVLHEGTVEIPDETVQELDCHSTPNDENPCSSTTEDGINCEQACDDGKVSSALSINVSRQAPCQQCVSVDIPDDAVPLACISQGTNPCLDFPGRVFLPQSSFKETACEQTPTKTSLCPPQFLGLSLPMNKNSGADIVQDFPSTSMSSSIFENRSWTPGWKDLLSSSASNKNLLIDRHRQLIDNAITREGFLKGSPGSSLDKFKGSVNQWSEEELDFLWIGVRRHGRGNWEAMLKDPKLHFSEWRVAEDLAEQWHVEQSKLLNVTQFQPVRSSKPDFFPTSSGGFWAKAGTRSQYCSYDAEHHVSKFPALRTETELSLGDVYVQKEERTQKRYPFHLSGPASTLPLSKNDNSNFPVGITNSILQNMGAKQQKTVKGQRSHRYSDRRQAKYDTGCSSLQRKLDISVSNLPWSGEMPGQGKNKGTLNEDLPAGSPNQGNLPHWLREAFSMPQRSTVPAPAVPSSVPAIAHSVSLLCSDKPLIPPFSDPCMVPPPPKDFRRMAKSRTNNKIANLRASDISGSVPCHPASSANVSWMETKLGLDSSTLIPATDNRVSDHKYADNLNKARSAPVRPDDLIVIDSDASSEETISDDRSGRH